MREPLLQFLAIALVLFGANQLIHGSSVQISSELITISQGRVQQIAESYRLLAGRLPSRAELQALVNDFADEEIAYREAIAMGLDADDTIVRRRMRQKLEFLAEDAEASEEPTDEQLADWLAEHAADYRLPERISFRHVLASADVRGDRANEEAAALLSELRSGADASRAGRSIHVAIDFAANDATRRSCVVRRTVCATHCSRMQARVGSVRSSRRLAHISYWCCRENRRALRCSLTFAANCDRTGSRRAVGTSASSSWLDCANVTRWRSSGRKLTLLNPLPATYRRSAIRSTPSIRAESSACCCGRSLRLRSRSRSS